MFQKISKNTVETPNYKITAKLSKIGNILENRYINIGTF